MKRTVCIVLLFASLCLAACRRNLRAPTDYENSAVGFDAFARDLVAAVSDGRQSDYERLATSLALPEPVTFFTRTFGPEAGARLTAEYDGYGLAVFGRESWDGLRTLVVEEGRSSVRTERHDRADDEQATGYQAIALRSAREPLALYNIRLSRPDDTKSFTLWSFVYLDGQFRLVGHMKKVSEPKPGGDFDEELAMLGELPVSEARRLMKDHAEKFDGQVASPSAGAASAAPLAPRASALPPKAAKPGTPPRSGAAAPVAPPRPKPLADSGAAAKAQPTEPTLDEDRYVLTIQ